MGLEVEVELGWVKLVVLEMALEDSGKGRARKAEVEKVVAEAKVAVLVEAANLGKVVAEAKVEMVEIEAKVATEAKEEMVASKGSEESPMGEKVEKRNLKHLKSLEILLCKLHTRQDLSWVVYNSMHLSCKCIDCLVWI